MTLPAYIVRSRHLGILQACFKVISQNMHVLQSKIELGKWMSDFLKHRALKTTSMTPWKPERTPWKPERTPWKPERLERSISSQKLASRKLINRRSLSQWAASHHWSHVASQKKSYKSAFMFCMHVCIMMCLWLCFYKVLCLSRAWLLCSAIKLLPLIPCVTHACVILFWTLFGLCVAFVRSMHTAMFYDHWVDFCRFCRIRIMSLLHVTAPVSLHQILVVLCLPHGLLCCSSFLVSFLY